MAAFAILTIIQGLLFLSCVDSFQILPILQSIAPRRHGGGYQLSSQQRNLLHPTNRSRGKLFSTTDSELDGTTAPLLLVGGKGGVGKTTTASALAVDLALNKDARVLLVSTDPAHSLGDCLGLDLRQSSFDKPVTLQDPLTRGNLHAAEINADEALQEFRDSLAGFDIDRLASSLGVSGSLLEDFGLQEFQGLLNSPPPGLDELVALSNIMDDNIAKDYDFVVVDTAPTGHTLRLLALPQFVDGLLGKLIKLRMKLSGFASTLQSFLGDSGARERAQTIDNALDKLDTFRRKISNMEARLKDAEKTNFVVVTVPTKLAVQESKRLVTELTTQGIAVKSVVVNQCVQQTAVGEALEKYYQRRREGQTKWINELTDAAAGVSASEEYRKNGDPTPIAVNQFPFFDVELVGMPALGYVGSQEIMGNPNFDHLIGKDDGGPPKVVIVGGKGGVGKTTTSSSLAVSMAASGHKVALISTDPAHSLGDAVDVDLSGGKLVDVPLIGVPGATGEGSLSALEIDPSSALGQFKGLVDKLIGGGDVDKGTGEGSEMKATLQELESVFDTLPAGTDEVVALAKVIALVKNGGFDRIVLDTAPTGHTLRMLGTPAFIADLIDRLLAIAEKIQSNAAYKMLVAGAVRGEKADQLQTAGTAAKSKLLTFQLQMYDLEDLFANPDQTEFMIVTIATELAVRESVRLLNDLTFEAPEMPIKVQNIVVNQVLQDDGSDLETFVSHISDGQASAIADLTEALQTMPSPPVITKVPYLDAEPREIYALKSFGDLLTDKAVASERNMASHLE